MDKAHGWDQLSIRMIKMCGDSIIFSLNLVFKSMINGTNYWRMDQVKSSTNFTWSILEYFVPNEGVFPADW